MLFDIDSKLSHINKRLAESSKRTYDMGIYHLNEHLKQNNQKYRYMIFGYKLRISKKGREKIDKIFQEENKKLWSRQED
jgi:transcription initiation factor TFIIIB Brf1 subunit/transcription initiation factor TFIIB